MHQDRQSRPRHQSLRQTLVGGQPGPLHQTSQIVAEVHSTRALVSINAAHTLRMRTLSRSSLSNQVSYGNFARRHNLARTRRQPRQTKSHRRPAAVHHHLRPCYQSRMLLV